MNKTLFLSLFAFQQLIAQDIIDVYHCYGNAQKLHLEGRVFDKREFQETKKEDSTLLNLWRKIGHIFNDERKNVPLTLTVDKHTFHTSTDDEGYFLFDLDFPQKTLKSNHPIYLQLGKQKDVKTVCYTFVPSTDKQVGIISDFDDTVIISDVTNKLKLLNQLLFKNYKQREAVKGMSEWYNEILKDTPDKALFFITGSPNQLHTVVEKFLDYHNFPKRSLITKKIHGDKAYSLLKQQNYKGEQIIDLITLYPNIKWILFGDSGEYDRDIYLDIAAKYPKHIKEIYIRDVQQGNIERIFPLNASALTR